MKHQKNNKNKNDQHLPVLLESVLQYLNPQKGNKYLDLTAGYGGHAQAILAQAENQLNEMVLVDRDQNAIKALSEHFSDKARLMHQDFLNASMTLLEENMKFDLILADLGVSSPHLNIGNRGFSIRESGPLDMRMDERQVLTADTIINSYSEAAIADILKTYGEEPKARLIAKAIVNHRPLHTTTELAEIVTQFWPGHSRVHPATRTFQALRIAVNDELEMLQKSLPLWIQLLNPKGRLAVISFHSLEDRLVKQAFSNVSGSGYDSECQLLTKKPITANQHELVSNPRARSAKLRVVVKIKI